MDKRFIDKNINEFRLWNDTDHVTKSLNRASKKDPILTMGDLIYLIQKVQFYIKNGGDNPIREYGIGKTALNEIIEHLGWLKIQHLLEYTKKVEILKPDLGTLFFKSPPDDFKMHYNHLYGFVVEPIDKKMGCGLGDPDPTILIRGDRKHTGGYYYVTDHGYDRMVRLFGAREYIDILTFEKDVYSDSFICEISCVRDNVLFYEKFNEESLRRIEYEKEQIDRMTENLLTLEDVHRRYVQLHDILKNNDSIDIGDNIYKDVDSLGKSQEFSEILEELYPFIGFGDDIIDTITDD